MTRERRARGGPPAGLAPRPERQRERSREALSRSYRRAEESEPVEPPDAVSRVGLIETQPFALLVYWSAGPRALSAAKRRVGDPEAALTVRFQDVSGTPGGTGEGVFDIPVSGESGSAPVKIARPYRLLRAELGVVGRDRRFSALARSNVAQTPQDRESEHEEPGFRKLREGIVPPPPPLEEPPDPPEETRPEARKLPAVKEDIHRVYGHSPPRFPAGPPPSNFPSAPLPERALRRKAGLSAPGAGSRVPPAILPAPLARPGAAPGSSAALSDDPPVGASAVANYFDVEVEPWMASHPDGPAAAALAGGPPPGGGEGSGSGGNGGNGSAPDGSSPTSPAPTSYGGISAEAIVLGEAFDLELHADVVIYGRARPGMKVYLSGTELTVKGDGTFEARFALPSPPDHLPRPVGGSQSGGNR